jgi:O-antigen/teichoic acid export membrane protein
VNLATVRATVMFDPSLAVHIADGKLRELERIVAKGRKLTYMLFGGVAVLALAAFPLYLALVGKAEFHGAWAPLALLIAGMFAASGYMPFAQTLLMANRPGWHTGMMASCVLCNAGLCLLLVPMWGLAGAATATALSLVWAAFALKFMVRRHVGLQI